MKTKHQIKRRKKSVSSICKQSTAGESLWDGVDKDVILKRLLVKFQSLTKYQLKWWKDTFGSQFQKF